MGSAERRRVWRIHSPRRARSEHGAVLAQRNQGTVGAPAHPDLRHAERRSGVQRANGREQDLEAARSGGPLRQWRTPNTDVMGALSARLGKSAMPLPPFRSPIARLRSGRDSPGSWTPLVRLARRAILVRAAP